MKDARAGIMRLKVVALQHNHSLGLIEDLEDPAASQPQGLMSANVILIAAPNNGMHPTPNSAALILIGISGRVMPGVRRF